MHVKKLNYSLHAIVILLLQNCTGDDLVSLPYENKEVLN